MDCNNKIETIYLGEIPIDNRVEMPDFFLTEVDYTDETTGNVVSSLVRVPAGKILPNGNLDNVTTIATNNETLDNMTEEEVDWTRQVLAGYLKNEGTVNRVYLADASNAPVFLMRGELGPGIMLIQNTGFITITAGHEYIVGMDYYLGEDGKPTTDSSITGWHLFTVLSQTQLAVNIYKAQ